MTNLNDIKFTDNMSNHFNQVKNAYFDGSQGHMDYQLVDIYLEGSKMDDIHGDDWVFKTCFYKDVIGHLQDNMSLVTDCHSIYINFKDLGKTFDYQFDSNDFDASNYKGHFEYESPLDERLGVTYF